MMKKSRFSDVAHSLILIMLLATSVFLLLTFEINAYEKLVKENNEISDTHLPYAYLINKCRNAQSISYSANELKLSDEITDTYVYLHDGYLCEITVFKGDAYDAKAGDRLFRMEDFRISEDNEKLNISYAVDETSKNIVFNMKGKNHE